jgi:hypothetical protein
MWLTKIIFSQRHSEHLGEKKKKKFGWGHPPHKLYGLSHVDIQLNGWSNTIVKSTIVDYIYYCDLHIQRLLINATSDRWNNFFPTPLWALRRKKKIFFFFHINLVGSIVKAFDWMVDVTSDLNRPSLITYTTMSSISNDNGFMLQENHKIIFSQRHSEHLDEKKFFFSSHTKPLPFGVSVCVYVCVFLICAPSSRKREEEMKNW